MHIAHCLNEKSISHVAYCMLQRFLLQYSPEAALTGFAGADDHEMKPVAEVKCVMLMT